MGRRLGCPQIWGSKVGARVPAGPRIGVTPSNTSGCHPVAPPPRPPPGSSRWPQGCHPLTRVQLCSRVGSRVRVPPREPAARALARVLVWWAQAWACKGCARPRAHTCARPTRTWRPAKVRLCTGARWQGCARCQCAGGENRDKAGGRVPVLHACWQAELLSVFHVSPRLGQDSAGA